MPATGGRIAHQNGTALQIIGDMLTQAISLVTTQCIGAESYVVARIDLDEQERCDLIVRLGGTP